MLLTKKQSLILLSVLAGAFLISLAYSFYFRIPPSVDARAYDNIAWNVARGYGYRESLEGPLAEDNSIMRVGPGYEFFLAAIYYSLGHHYEAVWVIQALLLALSALIVFLLVREIFWIRGGSLSDDAYGDFYKSGNNYVMGIAAAVLVGFSPDLITIQGMLMTEMLGVFLVILASYLFFRYLNRPTKSHWLIFIVGLISGFAGTVRTPALFLLLPITWVLIKNKKWQHLLFFVLAVAIIFAPWVIRNHRIYNAFVPTNLAYGIDLGAGNHAGANGELEPYPANDFYLNQYGLVDGSRHLTKEALKFIIFNPLEFLKLTTYRISIYFSFSRPTGFWFHLHGLSKIITLVLSAAYSFLLFVLGFWGIWQIRNLGEREKKFAKLFFALLIMMPLAIVGIIVETRYRFLVYPFFAVFAGYGFSELWFGRLPWKQSFYLASLLVLNAGFDIFRNLSRVLEKIQNLY